MLFIIIAVIFVLIFVNWLIKYNEICMQMRKFPGPEPLPFIGNILSMPSSTQEIPDYTLRLNYKYGNIFRFQIGFHHVLIIADKTFLEFILTSQKLIQKSKQYDFLHRWLGSGLLTSTGEKWHKKRKLLTPAFHFQILEQFIGIFDSSSDVLVSKLKEKTSDSSVNIYNYLNLCSLDIICESIMGIKINAQENSRSQYVISVKEMETIFMNRAMSIIKHVDFFYRFSNDYQREKNALKYLHETTREVIVKRRKELWEEAENKTENEEKDGVKKKKLPFLDLLLQGTLDGRPLTDEEIREEVDTFMFEGHDTTSSVLGSLVYILSKYPDVQRKIYEEVTSILHGEKKSPTYEDLQNMKYLEMVIKETLRLYPPVPAFTRRVNEEFEFEGRIIPKGVTLVIASTLVHLDMENYPDSDKFDPERFSPENLNERKPFTYIPFSAGPRNCIGQKFAMLEMKSIVSKLLLHFVLSPVPDFEPIYSVEIVLKSKNGFLVKLEERK